MERQIDNLYGLIGYPLSHSFSKKYFSEKFEKEGLLNHAYQLFELPTINDFQSLVSSHPNLKGLNVTIPYKEKVLPFIDRLDESAASVGAVNVIKFGVDNDLVGYNSDYYGFKNSLKKWLPANGSGFKALVLGTGGASKAVTAALISLGIEYVSVSRKEGEGVCSYQELMDNPQTLEDYKLIVNTTPLGMSPKVNGSPQLDYEHIGGGHFLYDLVYNPEHTLFLKKGQLQGARTKNGIEMLNLQAEKSWEIWTGMI